MAGDIGDPEPPQETADGSPDIDDLTVDDFDVTSKEESPLIPQIAGHLDAQAQFARFLDEGMTPEEAVGALNVIYTGLPLVEDDFTYYSIDRDELTRLYLYRELSDLKDYEIGKDPDNTDDRDLAHYLFVHPSKKKLNLSDTGLADSDNWNIYYTNVNPREYNGGGKALHERYRLRWGVETSYRMLKNEFLVTSGSVLQEKREFLVMLGFLYDCMWRAAVCKHARKLTDQRDDGTVIRPKDEHGRYLFSSYEFMFGLTNDFDPVDIGTVRDLSADSNIVEFCKDTEI